MAARERDLGAHRARWAVLTAVAVLIFALIAGLGSAEAKKKKKKKQVAATTLTAAAPLLPSSTQTATANCGRKSHIAGGGYRVDPPYSANGTLAITNDTGTRAIEYQSQPSGKINWSSGLGAFGTPATPGTLTTIARCESDLFGKLASISSNGGAVPPDTIANVNAACPTPNTHVISGGFLTDPPGDLTNLLAARPIVLQSRRTSARQWTVTVVNPTTAVGPVNVNAFVACEFDRGSSRIVNETFATAAIPQDSRAEAVATCGANQHVISGGFQVSPATSGTSVPAVGIDQNQPIGASQWQVGLYEYPAANPPAGSALTTYAYCKSNKAPKQPKKKKGKTIKVVLAQK